MFTGLSRLISINSRDPGARTLNETKSSPPPAVRLRIWTDPIFLDGTWFDPVSFLKIRLICCRTVALAYQTYQQYIPKMKQNDPEMEFSATKLTLFCGYHSDPFSHSAVI